MSEAIDQAVKRGPKRWEVVLLAGTAGLGALLLMLTPTIYAKIQSYDQRQLAAAQLEHAKAVLKPGNAGKVDPLAAARGKTLFAQGCNACHGDDAKGKPGLGKDLVHSGFVHGQADAQLVNFLKRGRDISDPLNTTKVPMPPKGGNPALTDKQLTDLAAYIRGIQE
ncbi:MAG TPA: cytochrome c [Tepidisphaeraceae bacterium]|jgi:disulfide bond formation protein DsbB